MVFCGIVILVGTVCMLSEISRCRTSCRSGYIIFKITSVTVHRSLGQPVGSRGVNGNMTISLDLIRSFAADNQAWQ